jgi:hypothetical protein
VFGEEGDFGLEGASWATAKAETLNKLMAAAVILISAPLSVRLSLVRAAQMQAIGRLLVGAMGRLEIPQHGASGPVAGGEQPGATSRGSPTPKL